MAGKPWTDEEIDLMREHSREDPAASCEDIVGMLRVNGYVRTPPAIWEKCRQYREALSDNYGRDAKNGSRTSGVGRGPIRERLTDLERSNQRTQELLARLVAQLEQPGNANDPRPISAAGDQVDTTVHRVPVTKARCHVVINSDIHAPYHSVEHVSRWLSAVYELRDRLGPDEEMVVVLNGDIVDGTSLGGFSEAQYAPEISYEVPPATKLLQEIREASGEMARIVYTEGNHEDRARRDHLRSVRGAPGFGWRHWLQLDQHRIDWVPSDKPVEVGSRVEGYAPLTCEHGIRTRKYAGKSVLGHMAEPGCGALNVAIGHCHRTALVGLRWRERVVYGLETGGMWDWRNPRLRYLKKPDWQPGWGYVLIDGETMVGHPEAVLMQDNGRFQFHGKLY